LFERETRGGKNRVKGRLVWGLAQMHGEAMGAGTSEHLAKVLPGRGPGTGKFDHQTQEPKKKETTKK